MADDYWRPAFELILEESRRSIDRQSERVQNVRERAIGLVGFGSLVAVALGLGAENRLEVLGGIAIGAFVAVTVVALYVLMPREFRFELGARKMSDWFDNPDNRGINHMIHTTAIHHAAHHDYNHRKLQRLQAALAVGVGALSVETVACLLRLVV